MGNPFREHAHLASCKALDRYDVEFRWGGEGKHFRFALAHPAFASSLEEGSHFRLDDDASTAFLSGWKGLEEEREREKKI